jgi:hypothetical protein
VPDLSTLCRQQKTLSVAIPYQGSKGALNLLIDGTGIKAEGEGEWNARKHGGAKRRLWRKIHIGIDEETLEIRANIGDPPMLPNLLDQIAPGQKIGSVTAPSHGLQTNYCRAVDGAHDTRKCHDAIAARNARAIIAPRKNAKLWKPDTLEARARNEAVQSSKDLGRAQTGYHRRSRIETKMNCLKLMGQRLAARDFDRQVAEVQTRAAILNCFTALGIPRTMTVG